MKNKNIFIIFIFLLLLNLTSCNIKQRINNSIKETNNKTTINSITTKKSGSFSVHEHTFNETYDYTSELHYRSSTCGHNVFIDLAPHTFNSDNECTICGYKKETKNIYYISFITNSDQYIEPLKVLEGEPIPKIEDPIKEDYTFLGWYLNEDFNGERFEFNKRASMDLSLYALWGAKVTFLNRDSSIYKEYRVRLNEVIEEIESPIAIGLHFMSWHTDYSLINDPFSFDTPIIKNTTLYPMYGYEVKVLSKSGDLLNSLIYKEGTKCIEPTKEDIDYYDFLYFSINNKDEYDFNTVLKSDITLYPIYSPKTYNINYINTEGLIHSNPTTYTYTIGLDEVLNPSLNEIEDDKFYGWYKDIDYTIPFDKIDELSHEDINVYAKRAKLYSINYINYPVGLNNPNPTKYTIYDEILFDYKELKNLKGFSNIKFLISNMAVPGIPLNTTGDIDVLCMYDAHTTTIMLDPNKGRIIPTTPYIYIDFNIDGMDPIKLNVNNDLTDGLNIYDPNVLKIPENPGYIFNGFYIDSKLENILKLDSINTIESGDTIYARWDPILDLNKLPYNNHGDNNSLSYFFTIPYNMSSFSFSLSTSAINGASITLSDQNGELYKEVFDGLNTISIYDVELDLSNSSILILSATFTPFAPSEPVGYSFHIEVKDYKKSYIKCTGTSNKIDEIFEYYKINEINIPTRLNSEFLGWYDSDNNLVDLNTLWLNMSDNIELHALWKSTRTSEFINQLNEEVQYYRNTLEDFNNISLIAIDDIVDGLNSIIENMTIEYNTDIDDDDALEIYLNTLDEMKEYVLEEEKKYYIDELSILTGAFKQIVIDFELGLKFDEALDVAIKNINSKTTINSVYNEYETQYINIQSLYDNR